MSGLFFKEFVRNFREIGSICPSSDYLIEKMIKPIDFENAECIVELGCGTGPITDAIIERLGNNSTLLGFESNKELAKGLERIVFPNFKLVNDSAEKLCDYIVKYGFEKADYIVSGLPLVVLPDNVKEKILSEVKNALNPGGKYIQFQYSLKSLSQLKSLFDKVDIDYTLLNIPPAVVYCCSNPSFDDIS